MASVYCRKRGAFYTPPALAEWVAAEILSGAISTNTNIRNVIDPACGSGALLRAMRRVGGESIKSFGIDIDPDAVEQCKVAIGTMSDIRTGDALNLDLHWGEGPPDAVIVNPPWGADLTHDRQFYKDSGYRLAFRQFDISDLFVERALGATEPGAILGFILPDSVFQPDHKDLREMLLEHTLLLIARLGEGIFEGIYRSTVVIVLRKGEPKPSHIVECLQVPASQRRLLVQGMTSFAKVKEKFSHGIPQSRFSKNPKSVFNISQSEGDHDVFEKFSRIPAFNWEEDVFIGRGVEIGKRGVTVCCEECGRHRAAPANGASTTCPWCHALIREHSSRHRMINDLSNGSEWCPVIVGEDVDRYVAAPRRFIKLGVPGIRYKPMEHFLARKLLIRKTGVGLRAAVDESGAATTQTVFYVIPTSKVKGWLLDYLQGTLNSRPMLAWYLRWSGENQWRSHPYVTPSVIRELPIPDPYTNAQTYEIARRIAEESKSARAGTTYSEHTVDALVARLYGFQASDVSWIRDVIADTEEHLEYFKRMNTGIKDNSLGSERSKVLIQ